MVTRRQDKSFSFSSRSVQFAFKVLIRITHVKKSAYLQGLALTLFFLIPFFCKYERYSENNFLPLCSVSFLFWRQYFGNQHLLVDFISSGSCFRLTSHYINICFHNCAHLVRGEHLEAASSHHLWEEIYQKLIITQFLS